MCTTNPKLPPVLTAKTIAKCRHPKEKFLFRLMATVTSIALAGMFAASFVREELLAEVKPELIQSHRATNPEIAHASDKDVFANLSEDDKQLHSMLQMLYWPVVLSLPLVFVAIMIGVTGIPDE